VHISAKGNKVGLLIFIDNCYMAPPYCNHADGPVNVNERTGN